PISYSLIYGSAANNTAFQRRRIPCISRSQCDPAKRLDCQSFLNQWFQVAMNRHFRNTEFFAKFGYFHVVGIVQQFFYFMLSFNGDNRISSLKFSPLYLATRS